MKGSVMTGEEFFFRAFGQNEEEFLEILHMPERILMYRTKEPQSEERDWLKKFRALTSSEKIKLVSIISTCRTQAAIKEAYRKEKSLKFRDLLDYYLPDSKIHPLLEVTNI